MSHNGMQVPHHIEWEDCRMQRYDTNNGIVLFYDPHRDHRSNVIFYIDGADLGFGKADHGPEVLERAEPLFKIMVNAHNRAMRMGIKTGHAERVQMLKEALDIEF